MGAMAGREGREGTRGGDGNVLHLDCGGGYLTMHVSKQHANNKLDCIYKLYLSNVNCKKKVHWEIMI